MKQTDGQISMFEYMRSFDKKPEPTKTDTNVCKFSGHTCNKEELWNVATDCDIKCQRTCCRMCTVRLCGARCNGSEEPLPADEYIEAFAKKLIEYCNKWGYKWLPSIMESDGDTLINNFKKKVCKYTKTYYFPKDKETYSAEFKHKDDNYFWEVKKCSPSVKQRETIRAIIDVNALKQAIVRNCG